ncbi:MAG: MBL fold metallo-hydrolase [Candidatus Paceibacterota bacterium]|jgi:ribonuclease BN (tRNA processing enzyme)
MKTAYLAPTEKLSLTNDGNLEVFFIGTGSAFARKHFQTNLLLIKGKEHLMVDFGMTGPLALATTARLDHGEINNLLISHSHADHIGGLECLALNRRYVGIPFQKRPKLKMIITEAYQEVLWDRSLRGGMEWNEEEENSHKRLCFTDFFDPIRPGWLKKQPREVYEVNFGGMHIEMFRTKHIPDKAPDWQASFVSFGLFIDGHVFISMDTRFDEDLIHEYADRSSVMFHDVQFFPGAVHAPLAELRTLPPEVKAKMHLMHYADNWETQDITGFAGWVEQGVRYIF